MLHEGQYRRHIQFRNSVKEPVELIINGKHSARSIIGPADIEFSPFAKLVIGRKGPENIVSTSGMQNRMRMIPLSRTATACRISCACLR